MTYIKLAAVVLAFFLFFRLLKALYCYTPIHPIFKLLLISILLLMALKGLVFALERIMPFVPSRRMELTPDNFYLKWKDVRFTAPGEESPKLHGWFIRAREKVEPHGHTPVAPHASTRRNLAEANPPSSLKEDYGEIPSPQHPRSQSRDSMRRRVKGTILYFHGNAGNISHRLPYAFTLSEAGYNVFLFDYRGYGLSEGSPSEKGCYKDAEGAYEYLVQKEGLSPDSIIFMGRSLGTAVALDLAVKKPPSSLVLISPLTSVKDVAKSIAIYYPFSFFMTDMFDNAKKISRLTAPLLIAHSPDDEILSYKMGKALFEKAPEPKAFLKLAGGHNEDYFENREWLDRIDEFMTQKK